MMEPANHYSSAVPHSSFSALHKESGSGIYAFSERVGLGGVFRLTSSGAIALNPDDTGPHIPHHDIYDVLRAVEERRVTKLVDPAKEEAVS